MSEKDLGVSRESAWKENLRSFPADNPVNKYATVLGHSGKASIIEFLNFQEILTVAAGSGGGGVRLSALQLVGGDATLLSGGEDCEDGHQDVQDVQDAEVKGQSPPSVTD
ncbi:hypothetical protein HUJ05_006896 [Dendroctonus ponderosae]|nr:hypothetical protein HUJ05_006896 [Dendroctonus ponderosae]